MAVIYRPCYCTREEVRRATELKQAAYANDRIDRAVLAATESVEGLAQRRFYPEDATRKFDWPNYQLAPPWKLYLDQHELAAQPTLVQTGSLVTIPSTQYILHPINEGPPYTRLELKQDSSAVFGYSQTPQLDIAITGTFGYWARTRPAGTLVSGITSSQTTITVSSGALSGVGDVLICGTERMVVTDARYVDTAISYSGLSSASASDRTVAVPDGSLFGISEVLRVDSEWILVEDVLGNVLTVRRGWDGSQLAAHANSTLWARRLLSVLRGQLGTISATHSGGDALSVSEVPGLIRELAIAEASVFLAQERGGYASGRGPSAGPGLADLRTHVESSRFVRHVRSRVVLWTMCLVRCLMAGRAVLLLLSARMSRGGSRRRQRRRSGCSCRPSISISERPEGIRRTTRLRSMLASTKARFTPRHQRKGIS